MNSTDKLKKVNFSYKKLKIIFVRNMIIPFNWVCTIKNITNMNQKLNFLLNEQYMANDRIIM